MQNRNENNNPIKDGIQDLLKLMGVITVTKSEKQKISELANIAIHIANELEMTNSTNPRDWIDKIADMITPLVKAINIPESTPHMLVFNTLDKEDFRDLINEAKKLNRQHEPNLADCKELAKKIREVAETLLIQYQ